MVFVESKVCRICNINKTLDNFHNRKSSKDGHRHECKTCVYVYHKNRRNGPKRDLILFQKRQYNKDKPQIKRNSHLKNTYGICLEEFNKILNTQGNCCKICKSSKPLNNQHNNLYVDHCHKTGKIRGILCNPCNTTLGAAKEDISRLQGCIEYLK